MSRCRSVSPLPIDEVNGWIRRWHIRPADIPGALWRSSRRIEVAVATAVQTVSIVWYDDMISAALTSIGRCKKPGHRTPIKHRQVLRIGENIPLWFPMNEIFTHKKRNPWKILKRADSQVKLPVRSPADAWIRIKARQDRVDDFVCTPRSESGYRCYCRKQNCKVTHKISTNPHSTHEQILRHPPEGLQFLPFPNRAA